MSSARRGMGPKSSALAAEAIDMEAKLLELKKAMELERAKREKQATEGRYWQSGTAGALRSKYRARQGSPLPPVNSQAAGEESCIGSQRRPSATSPEALTALSGLEGRAGLAARKTSIVASTGSSKHSEKSHTPASSHAIATHSSPTAAQPVGSRLQSPAAGVLPTASPREDNLADGTFDEADSHQSFLEALHAWRAGSKAATSTPVNSQQHPPEQAAHQSIRTEPAGCAPSSSNVITGIQTETNHSHSRPSSSKPVSYFNRLVMSSASRQAGQAALPSSSCSSTSPAAGETGGGHASCSSSQLVPAAGLQVVGGGDVMLSTQNPALTAPSLAGRPSNTSLPPLSPRSSNTSQVYALDAAMPSASSQPPQPSGVTRHKGLDILEELERLEVKAAQQYDDDDEWAALLSPYRHVGVRAPVPESLPEFTTQHAGVGLTKGVRLPDAILLPEEEDD